MWQSIKLLVAPKNIILSSRGPKPKHMLRSLNKVHFHFTPNVRTHQLVLFPMVQPVDDFQGPFNFQSHGSWFVFQKQKFPY